MVGIGHHLFGHLMGSCRTGEHYTHGDARTPLLCSASIAAYLRQGPYEACRTVANNTIKPTTTIDATHNADV